MSESSGAARSFYRETIPKQFNAALHMQEEAGAQDAAARHIFERMRAVNTTISFHYNAPDRSLSQEEINHRQTKLAELLESRHGWPA